MLVCSNTWAGGPSDDGAIARQVQRAVGVLHHPLQPVLGQHHGDPEVVHQPRDGSQDFLGRGRIERRGRFVQHQNSGMGRQHRTDRDPLLLSTRQRPQRPVPEFGQPEQIQRLLHPLAHDVRKAMANCSIP